MPTPADLAALPPITTRAHRARRGFTLIELLVVLSIIALLISILLPALAGSREVARRVQCLANQRGLGQAVNSYIADEKGYLPGSPHTNAYEYLDPGGLTPVDPAGAGYHFNGFDWQTPLAQAMGLPFNFGRQEADRVERYGQMVSAPPFRCPSNEFLFPPFTVGNPNFAMWPVTYPMSYRTSIDFMLLHNASNTPPDYNQDIYPFTEQAGANMCRTEWNVPMGYRPHIDHLGQPAKKLFLAEGSRFVQYAGGTLIGPDYDTNRLGTFGATGSDQRLYCPYNRSLPRDDAAPPYLRSYTLRHQQTMNLLFFDGHAQSARELDAMDPAYWSPRGTALEVNDNQVWQDVIDRYFDGQTFTWSDPFILP